MAVATPVITSEAAPSTMVHVVVWEEALLSTTYPHYKNPYEKQVLTLLIQTYPALYETVPPTLMTGSPLKAFDSLITKVDAIPEELVDAVQSPLTKRV